MTIAKKFVYVKPFEGMPKNEDLKIMEEELPDIKDGEFLVEAIYLSVDPYMRAWAPNLKVGDVMIGSQVAKVVKSKSLKFPGGKYVVGNFGWRSHTIVKEKSADVADWGAPRLVPFDPKKTPISLALGTLGMPGNTAYFGFLEICKPKPGETVVTGAAGAVGSHVGQIAKIKGGTVIGITGSDDKVTWLKSLGFDHVINYKTQDVKEALSEAAPKGVDCYFDNVGGETSSIILDRMNNFGRISVCGSISSYNADVRPKATIIQPMINIKQLSMIGFLVNQWIDRWDEGILQNLKWIEEGKLQYKETITEGFENMTAALIGVLQGENIGKAVVKV